MSDFKMPAKDGWDTVDVKQTNNKVGEKKKNINCGFTYFTKL